MYVIFDMYCSRCVENFFPFWTSYVLGIGMMYLKPLLADHINSLYALQKPPNVAKFLKTHY